MDQRALSGSYQAADAPRVSSNRETVRADPPRENHVAPLKAPNHQNDVCGQRPITESAFGSIMAIGPRRAQVGNRKVSRMSSGIIKAGVQTPVAGVKPRSLNRSEPRERRNRKARGVNPGHWCKPCYPSCLLNGLEPREGRHHKGRGINAADLV